MKNKIILFVSIIIGSLIAYLLYPVISCHTGHCPLTSNVGSLVFLGGFLGYVFGDLIITIIKKSKDKK